ncbi:MAG: hypothetical protein RJA07_312 [Bacteroidota bacterium]|jgi:hypothetical protein
MQIQQGGLSNMQMELVKMFNYNLPETELQEIKQLLVQYFAKKVSDDMDAEWQRQNWTDETMNVFLNEHLRTKYE